MKKYKIFCIGLLVTFQVACDKQLNIQPEQSVSTEIALSTPENIQNLLIGTYHQVGYAELYGGFFQMFSDLYGTSGQVQWTGTFVPPRQVFTKSIFVDNVMIRDVWLFAYKGINMANLIIDHINVVENLDDQNRILGEAKFLRALAYFDLVRSFGAPYEAGQQNNQLGVPLSLQGVLDYSGDLTIARNTVEEVYSQVIIDLNDAYDLLPPNNSFFADKYAAKALLARIYLQQSNFGAARDAANDVIGNSGHGLTGSFAAAFNNDANSSEDIFAIQVTSQDGENELVVHYADEEFGGRGGDILVTDSYVNMFDSDTDDRASFFYTSNFNRGRLTSKYVNQFAKISMIRLAEMYLIRAEGNLREGTSAGDSPVNDINAIRDRANASLKLTVTIEDILLERELELGFEGFLIHDYKRTGRSVGSLPYNDNRLVYPIPQRERDANPLLEPNPGYGS